MGAVKIRTNGQSVTLTAVYDMDREVATDGYSDVAVTNPLTLPYTVADSSLIYLVNGSKRITLAVAGGGTYLFHVLPQSSTQTVNLPLESIATDGTKQPLSADLTAIAGLTPTNGDVIRRQSGAWANQTLSGLKADFFLAKADVGLGSVDNTADTAKPVSTAQATALGLKVAATGQTGPVDLSTAALTLPATVTGLDSTAFDDFELRRSSACGTWSRLNSASGLTLSSGGMYSAVAFCKTAGTFTKIRFCTAQTVTSPTEIRLGVHNAAGVLLASTVSVHATVTTVSTVYDNLALAAGVTLTQGQQIYLSIGFTGTALLVRGLSLPAGIGAWTPSGTPVLGISTTYAGGTLPSLGSTNSGVVPWIELIP